MSCIEKIPLPVRWDDGENVLVLLDQRVLPLQTVYVTVRTCEEAGEAIANMTVRGAPAIGISAAYGMVLAAQALQQENSDFLRKLEEKGRVLAAARPTAVNLSWAVEQMLLCARSNGEKSPVQILQAMLACAKALHAEDEDICRRIGESLQPRMWDGMGVLTHCNAGQLATTKWGTALSPVYVAMERGLHIRVFSDETRPRLQGSTLTAYELHCAGADVTTICDNMACVVMSQKKIDCCIVGCDRVAANGDTANKIGTYGVAVLAKHFGIPFYVAAPTPTIDFDCPDGSFIPIEERSTNEISMRFGERTVPEGVKMYNPGFDVTPHGLITGFATEYGLIEPPFDIHFAELTKKLKEKRIKC